MSVMDFGAFADLLDERFREIRQEELASQREIIGEFYTQRDSDRRQERMSSVGELGQWPQFTGSLTFDQLTQQFDTVATHIERATGMIITRRLFDDDLSGVLRGDRFRAMVRAGVVTRNVDAARFFNFMDSDDQFFYVRSEGVPLVSDSHTTATAGVSTASGFDNLTTSALSPTSYRAARIQMRKLANDRGDTIDAAADRLVVPVDLEPRAQEILQTPRGLDSNFGNVNPEQGTAQIRSSVHFNDTNNWAIANEEMMRQNLIWWNRVNPEYETIKDFETKQIKSSGYQRYSIMILDWRWIVGGVVS